jgi:hypothetical protein
MEDDLMDDRQLENARTMILAEKALWDSLDYFEETLEETEVPRDVWNCAVEAIEELRLRLGDLGLVRWYTQLKNFHPITDDRGVRSKPGIDSVGGAETL